MFIRCVSILPPFDSLSTHPTISRSVPLCETGPVQSFFLIKGKVFCQETILIVTNAIDKKMNPIVILLYEDNRIKSCHISP